MRSMRRDLFLNLLQSLQFGAVWGGRLKESKWARLRTHAHSIISRHSAPFSHLIRRNRLSLPVSLVRAFDICRVVARVTRRAKFRVVRVTDRFEHPPNT